MRGVAEELAVGQRDEQRRAGALKSEDRPKGAAGKVVEAERVSSYGNPLRIAGHTLTHHCSPAASFAGRPLT